MGRFLKAFRFLIRTTNQKDSYSDDRRRSHESADIRMKVTGVEVEVEEVAHDPIKAPPSGA